MDNLIKLYTDFILESKAFEGTFEEFAKVRHDGASKIANAAKEKGGAAMLTYHHFIVKLPYYKKAASGKFDAQKFSADLSAQMEKLNSGMSSGIGMKQVEFQRVMGIIEVLGELLIKSQEYA
jgi:hypothetical protein